MCADLPDYCFSYARLPCMRILCIFVAIIPWCNLFHSGIEILTYLHFGDMSPWKQWKIYAFMYILNKLMGNHFINHITSYVLAEELDRGR